MSELTFKEKSLWILLASLVLVFGNYYLQLNIPEDATIKRPEMFELGFYVVFLLIVIIVGHIIITAKGQQEQTDERQQQIEVKAQSISTHVLTFGVFHAIVIALVIPGNFWVVHNLFLSVLLAEIVNIGLQLFYFRRGF